MTSIGRQTGPASCRWGVLAALVLAVGAAGCDSLLEVDLPAAVTKEAVSGAESAQVLLNAVTGQFECGYSSFLMDASGMEDNFQMVTGVAGNYSQYSNAAGGGTCDTDAYSQEWIDPFLIARALGRSNHENMTGPWASSPSVTQAMIGTNAFYTAAILDVFGEYFCEGTISTVDPDSGLPNDGPFMGNKELLDSAEAWVGLTMAAVSANGGDFEIRTTAGRQTPSITTSAMGLRARIRWARNRAGDLAAAAADAALVPDGHVTWVLRDAGEKRRNMVSVSQSGGGGIQAAGFLQGPVRLKTGTLPYGVSSLGSHPNGTAWPNPVRFTGYINLGIVSATGAALNATRYPVLKTATGAVEDVRVKHTLGNTAGGILDIPQRYPADTDDMPLINWKEMRLIRAEAAGNTQASIDHVNVVRAADGLPCIGPPATGVTCVNGGDASYRDAILADATGQMWQDMLTEERRRALFEEGRFWSTKIRWNTQNWFPRSVGRWVNVGAQYTLGGGVRLLWDSNEYQINLQWVEAGGLSLRGTGCDPYEKPVGF